MQRALSSLNAFGSDTHALTWVGQSADAFKATFGPLPGRLQKLYVSYGEASDALSAYWPKLQAAQTKADAALRQAQDASVDITRAAGTADDAAADLKTAQAGTDPAATAAAQDAHDAAQKNLQEAKARLAALAATAHQAHDDLTAAAKECAKAIHHAQSDGIHNKHWWQHVGETLSDLGGHIAQWASDIGQIAVVLAPVLNGLAALTIEVPGLDVVTAGLAAADDLIAATAPEVITAGTAIKATGDGLQGHWKDLGMDAAFLGASGMGAKARIGGNGLEADAVNGGRVNLTPEEQAEADKAWEAYEAEASRAKPPQSASADADAAWAAREAQTAKQAGDDAADAAAKARADIASSIARGHANSKHAGDFPGMTSTDLENHTNDVMSNPSRTKPLRNGRTAYLGQDGETIVIHDPANPDGGTVFRRPADELDEYWEDLS